MNDLEAFLEFLKANHPQYVIPGTNVNIVYSMYENKCSVSAVRCMLAILKIAFLKVYTKVGA